MKSIRFNRGLPKLPQALTALDIAEEEERKQKLRESLAARVAANKAEGKPVAAYSGMKL